MEHTQPLSTKEVEKQVASKRQSGEIRQVVKVLVLGNSGKGKSFLLNCLLGCGMFEHAYQTTSVTHMNSFALFVRDGTAYVLCNVPGLIESDPENIQRNKSFIEAAFRMLPQALTVVAFVIDPGTGGRLQAEDVEAYRSVVTYVPQLKAHSTAVVVNGMRKMSNPTAKENYQTQAKLMVQKFMERDVGVWFTPEVSDEFHDKYDAPEMRELGDTMLAVLQHLTPEVVQPKEGATLRLDRDGMKEEMDALVAEMKKQSEQHKEEMDKMSKFWQNELAQMRSSMQAQIAAIQAAGGKRGGFCCIM